MEVTKFPRHANPNFMPPATRHAATSGKINELKFQPDNTTAASVAQNPAVKKLWIRKNNFRLHKKFYAGNSRNQNPQKSVPTASLMLEQKHHA
jgi:hypothetical protein